MKIDWTQTPPARALLLGAAILASTASPALARESEPVTGDWPAQILRVRAERARLQAQPTRVVRLPNGLEAILIQDTGTATSAAAMSVGVGLLADPKEHPGLAHYLEHMLFLGSEKYPSIEGDDAFTAFCENRGGYANAYTDLDETNYQFMVNDSGFTEAVERWSQFFVAPIFNQQYAQRELGNVDSEYRKNFSVEGWRQQKLLRMTTSPQHPLSWFFQGSSESLATVTRQTLLDFHARHYSADRMKLAIVSPRPLDQLEALVREKFGAVARSSEPAYQAPSQVIDPGMTPRVLREKSTGRARALTLDFWTGSTRAEWRSRPLDLAMALVGDDGEGSLRESLLKRGLIMDAGASADNRAFGSNVQIEFELTERGWRDWRQVAEAFFAYVNMLRETGLEKRNFDDTSRTAEMAYLFDDSSRHGITAATQLAKQMQRHPAGEVYERTMLYADYDPATFRRFLDQLRPERMTALLSGPDAPTDQSAPFYGLQYSMQSLRGDAWIEELGRARSTLTRLPAANPYFPRSIDETFGEPMARPARVAADARGEIWAQTNHETGSPRAVLRAELDFGAPPLTAHERAVSRLAERAIERGLSSWSAATKRARLAYGTSVDARRLTAVFQGFGENLVPYVQDFFARLTKIEISEPELELYKTAELDAIADQGIQEPYRYALQTALPRVLDPLSVDEAAIAAELPAVTRAEAQGFLRRSLSRTYVRALAFGNLRASDAATLLDSISTGLGSTPLPSAERPRSSYVLLAPGQRLSYWTQGETADGAWTTQVQLGTYTPALSARLQFASLWLSAPFYAAMRTEKGFGYIVQGSPQIDRAGLSYQFLIQSTTPGADLSAAAWEWIEARVAAIDALPDAAFERMRASLVETLSAPISTFDNKNAVAVTGLFERGGNFAYRDQTAGEAKVLTRADFAAWLRASFLPETARVITAYVGAAGAPSRPDPRETPIVDVDAFHATSPTTEELGAPPRPARPPLL